MTRFVRLASPLAVLLVALAAVPTASAGCDVGGCVAGAFDYYFETSSAALGLAGTEGARALDAWFAATTASIDLAMCGTLEAASLDADGALACADRGAMAGASLGSAFATDAGASVAGAAGERAAATGAFAALLLP